MKNTNVNAEELLRNNVIDEETYNKIKIYCKDSQNKKVNIKENEKETVKNKSTNLLNILAGVLLALGVIWIVAANWNSITSSMKITCGILFLLCAYGWTFYSKKKCKSLEFQSIVLLGAAISNIALISMEYGIIGKIELFLLIILLMMYSIPFYTNSKILTYLAYVCSCIYVLVYGNLFVSFVSLLSEVDVLLTILSMVIIFVLCIISVSFKNEKIFSISLLLEKSNKKIFMLMLISNFILLFRILIELEIIEVTFVFISVFAYQIAKKYQIEFQRKLYFACYLIYMFIATHSLESLNTSELDSPLAAIFQIAIYGLVLWMLIDYFIKKIKIERENKDDKVNLYMMISSAVFLVIYILGYVDNINMIFELLTLTIPFIILCFSIHEMYYGIINRKMKAFNLGELIFVLLIARYLFEEDMSILVRGIVCIIISILILIVNKSLNKKLNSKDNNEKQIEKIEKEKIYQAESTIKNNIVKKSINMEGEKYDEKNN